MALMPTGLGWYADENWLRQSSGLMGKVMGGEGAGFAIVPQTPSVRPLTTDDCFVGAFSTPGHDHYYAALSQQEPVYFAYGPDRSTVYYSNIRHVLILSKERATIVYGFPDGYGGNPQGTFTLSVGTIGGYHYYMDYAIDGPHPPFNTDCGQYNSVAEAVAALGETFFYKLNSGYAVSAIVKWIPWNTNTPQISPVLISSVEPNTILSLNGSTAVSSALNTNAIDSKVFYMRYYVGNITEGDVTATGAQYVDFSTSHGPMTADMLFTLLARLASIGVGEVPSHEDPYSPGGTTGPGGGNGTHEIISTPVSISETPEFAITDAGFFSIWLPTEEQIRKIAAWMWNGNIATINFWKRMVSSPTELILGLSMVPFDATPAGSDFVRMGYINTGIIVNYTEEQFYELDFGRLQIQEVWGAYIDYNPYTSIEIFLPYIGNKRLDTDEIMNKTIHLVYKIDIISGACVAVIAASTSLDYSDETVLYQFMGNCALQIPVTSEQMVNIVRNTISLVTSIGSLATSGATPAVKDSGGQETLAHKAAIAGAAASALNLATTKQTAERTGSISSSAGFLGQQRPYLIIKHPRQAIPENQNTYTGYPSFITETLEDLSGYTEVEAIHLQNIPCTQDEMNEIDSALRGGVIF